MARQRFSVEQITHKLREADVAFANGTAVKQVSRQINIADKMYYRWRREYGGLKVDQAKRMKELEAENARLSGSSRNDGSSVRLRPEYKDHVWANDFVTGRTHDGRAFKMLSKVGTQTLFIDP